MINLFALTTQFADATSIRAARTQLNPYRTTDGTQITLIGCQVSGNENGSGTLSSAMRMFAFGVLQGEEATLAVVLRI